MKIYVKALFALAAVICLAFALANAAPRTHVATSRAALSVSGEETITGEVTDAMCAANKDQRGEKHQNCATMCMKDHGAAIVIVTDGEKIYTVDDSTSKEIKDTLIANAAKIVKVTGTVTSKDGKNTILVTKVEAE